MKKKLLAGLATGVMMLGAAGIANALTTTLVDQESSWEYSVLIDDLWADWGAADYSSFDWDAPNVTWNTGNAAFGNYYDGGLSYNTYWAANTDLALQKTFNIDGVLAAPVTLNVASDNGFMVFINGTLVAKQNAEGYTAYWEYTLPMSISDFLSPGSNLIQVLAEDHGVATFFDMKLTGDVAPVPEPATMLLMGTGLAGLVAARRRKAKKN